MCRIYCISLSFDDTCSLIVCIHVLPMRTPIQHLANLDEAKVCIYRQPQQMIGLRNTACNNPNLPATCQKIITTTIIIKCALTLVDNKYHRVNGQRKNGQQLPQPIDDHPSVIHSDQTIQFEFNLI